MVSKGLAGHRRGAARARLPIDPEADPVLRDQRLGRGQSQGSPAFRRKRGFAHQGPGGPRLCPLVQVPEQQAEREGRGDREVPARASRLAGAGRTAREGGGRPLPRRRGHRRGQGVLQRLAAADRRGQGRSRRGLCEGEQRSGRARTRRVRLARPSAQCRDRKEDPRPLRQLAYARASPGADRPAALSG